MYNSSNVTSLCDLQDKLCVIQTYQQEVIVIPVLFLAAFLCVLTAVCILRLCPKKEIHTIATGGSFTSIYQHHLHNRRHSQRQHRSSRQHLQGIDAPPELNPLEYEDIPMAAQTQNRPLSQPAEPHMATERQYESLQHMTPLTIPFTATPDNDFTLYQATVGQKSVVLRVLKEEANDTERCTFLAFGRFLAELGPHPFLPSLRGVVTERDPLIMVFEMLEHKDLLGFLWRCRQEYPGTRPPFVMTEKIIFKMGGQIASALAYLHSRNCTHGNIAARSVLVGQDLSVKLWGLGPSICRTMEARSSGQAELRMRKWQAPEVLARQPLSQSSDIWSFGILLYEMVTLGEPPFPKIVASELLQYLQRTNTLKKPSNCSNSLYSIITACCQWAPQNRVPLNELISKLQAGERRASDKALLQKLGPLDIEKYKQEAGYGGADCVVVV